MIIEFIVLACSYKHHDRCVAGIDITNHRLIRLISNNCATNYAIPKDECIYEGKYISPLDVIKVELLDKAPTMGAQTENFHISFPMVKKIIRKADISEIKDFVHYDKNFPYPFGSKSHYLTSKEYWHKSASLCLITAYSLKLYLGGSSNKTKLSFDMYTFFGARHRLEEYSVTDPYYAIFDNGNMAHKDYIGKAYLLISISSQVDFGDNYYKFVSSIIEDTNNKHLK